MEKWIYSMSKEEMESFIEADSCSEEEMVAPKYLQFSNTNGATSGHHQIADTTLPPHHFHHQYLL